MGAFGAGSLKRLEFYTTLPSNAIASIVRGRSEFNSRKLEIDEDDMPLAKLTAVTPRSADNRGHGWNPQGWVTGSKRALKESETYPPDFCLELARTVVACLSQSVMHTTAL
eukprot:3775315-Pyramimonas_sp.AAC.1